MRIKEFIEKHKKDIIIGTTGVVVGGMGMLYLRRNTIPRGIKLALVTREVAKKLDTAKIPVPKNLHVITTPATNLQSLVNDVSKTNLMDINIVTFTNIR